MTIETSLTKNELEFLYTTAKKSTGSGVVVGIGSWKGGSTVWLAKGSKMGTKTPVYAIDPHTGALEHQLSGEVSTLEEFQESPFGEI